MEFLLRLIRERQGSDAFLTFGQRLRALADHPIRILCHTGGHVEVGYRTEPLVGDHPVLSVRAVFEKGADEREICFFVLSGPGDHLELYPYRYIEPAAARDEFFANLEAGFPPRPRCFKRSEWNLLAMAADQLCQMAQHAHVAGLEEK